MNVAIPVAFLLVTMLLLWFCIYAKGTIWIKTLAIVMCGYFSLVLWNSLGTYAGWPTTNEPPDEFILHWAIVVEPNKTENESGAIFIWITGVHEHKNYLTFLGYSPLNMEPRAYKLPYSRQLHQAIDGAMQSLRKGRIVRGRKCKHGNSDFDGGNDAGGKENNDERPGGGSLSNEQEYQFHELLPTRLPQK
ncbi:MAG: hypothetical protein QXU32_00870 [Nitrososphaerales archaeon]